MVANVTVPLMAATMMLNGTVLLMVPPQSKALLRCVARLPLPLGLRDAEDLVGAIRSDGGAVVVASAQAKSIVEWIGASRGTNDIR